MRRSFCGSTLISFIITDTASSICGLLALDSCQKYVVFGSLFFPLSSVVARWLFSPLAACSGGFVSAGYETHTRGHGQRSGPGGLHMCFSSGWTWRGKGSCRAPDGHPGMIHWWNRLGAYACGAQASTVTGCVGRGEKSQVSS